MASGPRNGKWKGGTSVNNKHHRKDRDKKKDMCPYLRITAGPLAGVYVHTIVMEAKLGRKLLPHETVEHADGNGLNPHPDNLKVMTLEQNSAARWERERREANNGNLETVNAGL